MQSSVKDAIKSPTMATTRGHSLITLATGTCNGALHGVNAGSVCEVLAGLGRGLSFFVVPYDGGHRSAPRVVAALAGFVHDRQSADDYEYNHDNNNE